MLLSSIKSLKNCSKKFGTQFKTLYSVSFLIILAWGFASYLLFISCANKEFNSTREVPSQLVTSLSQETQQRAQALFKYTQTHPYGFTLDSRTFLSPSTGYAVAPFKDAQVVIDWSQASIDHMIQLIISIDKIAPLIKSPVYAGGWLNENENQYYLDVSLVVNFLDQALYLAQAGNQVAIYDLSHMKSIKTQEGIQELKAQRHYNTTQLKEAEDLVHHISEVLKK